MGTALEAGYNQVVQLWVPGEVINIKLANDIQLCMFVDRKDDNRSPTYSFHVLGILYKEKMFNTWVSSGPRIRLRTSDPSQMLELRLPGWG